MTNDKITVGSRSIEISNPEKVLFPDDGFAKLDIIEYYRNIAKTMLPHLRGRPVTMHRFPDGIDGEDFYQKDIPDYFPDWVKRTQVKKKGGTVTHVVCENAATLVYLANQACIVPHVWLSRTDRLNHPDRMVFDLDPSSDDFEAVRTAAKWLHQLLDEIELRAFLMTTGSRGLHVVVPLDRSADFETVRALARDIAEALVESHPKELTAEQRKEKRGDRIFIDTLRNAYAQTTPAPYSVRAKAGAPVATPLDWEELSNSDLHSQRYTIKNVLKRISQKGDPWSGIGRHARSVGKARRRLEKLSSGAE